ncbi:MULTISPECIES: THUMP domain-containing class I SAM-dependent RNA methyltransferase [Desulfobacula]|uniref:Predicted RNA methylase n=2 Tax=Desulfobacula TaxID=28222 RepID=K0NTI0_DESTT|nr:MULTISPECIES: class I SAM-dependent RNA methyltransferase [Desulfobacula]CCK82367.1 predicted RNA methylase [Desulfobacula toluolica Tol2]SDU50787.1 putative N6-adenine-specific DNA methylase [Desulfobacula phenolica]
MNTGKKSILQKGKGKTRRQAKLAYLYEKESQYFAQVAESIKDIAIKELKELGAYNLQPVFRGIWFCASKKDFYRITYFSRLVSRVLAPLVLFEAHDKDELYKAAKKIRWEEFLTPKKTFSIVANVSESEITHSNFAGLRIKDAIADYFRDRSNKRPSVDAKDPYIIINLHLHRNMATLSIDASGGALHKRGYREESVSAPMQETVAASIIRLSEWDGTVPLYDPMCGSGTLLCEALMAYSRIPAQVFRTRFGFERLPDFNADLWERIKQESRDNFRELKANMILGSDVSEHSVNAARTNIMGLHFGSEINIELKDFQDIDAIEDSVIITNPPYGIRMGKDQNLNEFYQNLGLFLKNRCKNSKAFVYFGEPKYIKKVPLSPSWKRPLKIGGLDGKLVKYDLY